MWLPDNQATLPAQGHETGANMYQFKELKMSEFGVHSEVGKLRKVIVHRPGMEMRRLTPTNCEELLFDDVIWTRKARQEHDAFVDLMRAEFGVEVMRVHELLQDVVNDPEGRAYILDRKLVPNEVGVGGAVELRAWMDEMDSAKLVAHLIGGVTVHELPERFPQSWPSELTRPPNLCCLRSAQPAVHAGQLLLDLWRRHGEPDVLAGAA